MEFSLQCRKRSFILFHGTWFQPATLPSWVKDQRQMLQHEDACFHINPPSFRNHNSEHMIYWELVICIIFIYISTFAKRKKKKNVKSQEGREVTFKDSPKCLQHLKPARSPKRIPYLSKWQYQLSNCWSFKPRNHLVISSIQQQLLAVQLL